MCKVNSLSVFRHSDPQPTVQVPLSEVPQDDLGFAAMDALLASGIPFTRDPIPEVDPGVPHLDALRASGVSISRVSPAIPVVPEDTEEQTDSTWGVWTNGKLS